MTSLVFVILLSTARRSINGIGVRRVLGCVHECDRSTWVLLLVGSAFHVNMIGAMGARLMTCYKPLTQALVPATVLISRRRPPLSALSHLRNMTTISKSDSEWRAVLSREQVL